MAEQTEAIHVFCSYAREDKPLLELLRKHLGIPIRQGQMTFWYDREILPGEEWKHIIDEHLNEADIILLFISPDFIASDYCWGQEMQRALERQRAGDTSVIPILLRPTPGWETTPLGNLQALPEDARSITLWDDHEKAFENTAKGIFQLIQQVQRIDKYSIINFVLEFWLPISVVEWSGPQKRKYFFRKDSLGKESLEGDKILYENTVQRIKDISNMIRATLAEISEDEDEKKWRLTYQQYDGYVAILKKRQSESGEGRSGRYRYVRSTYARTPHLDLLNLFMNAAQVPYIYCQWTLADHLDITAITEQVQIQTGRRPSSARSTESHIEYTLYTHDENAIKMTLSALQPGQSAKVCLIYESSSNERGFFRVHELLSLRRMLSILRGELSHQRVIQLLEASCTPSQ